MGKIRSLAAASNIGVGVFIYFLAIVLNYKQIYLIVGIIMLGMGLWGLFRDPSDKTLIPQRKQLIFRKKYWLYYFLTFFAGARRQIFSTFAVFLLVKRFNFTIQSVTSLLVINNVINYFLSPFIGKCVIRFGERKVLSIEYFSMIFIFVAYAFVQSKPWLGVLYILDHIFFNFAFAIRTYFQKVGDPKDIAPSMAMGFTINHLAAVVLPAMGGFLWMVNYRIPFLAGAFFSLVSLTAVQKIRTSR